MKRIKFITMFVALAVVASTMFLGSCKKDEEVVKPTITITPTATAVKAGVKVTYTVVIHSDQDLKTLTISPDAKSATATANDTTITFGKGINDQTIAYVYTPTGNTAKITIKFTVADEDATEENAQTLDVTPSILTYATIQMGGADSKYGSYLDADAGISYLSGAVAANLSAIDIIFDQSSFKNTAKLVTTSTGTKLFLTSLTAAQFDAITSDATFDSYTAASDNVTVAVGSVVFFQASSGKKGLIKVTSMTSGTGDLVIAEKIQQ